MNEQDKNLCEELRFQTRYAVGIVPVTMEQAAQAIERLSGELEEVDALLVSETHAKDSWYAKWKANEEELAALKEYIVQLECANKTLTALKQGQGEPVAWLYEFDGYVEVLMPDEIEQDNFKEHPEMYKPLYLAPPVSIS